MPVDLHLLKQFSDDRAGAAAVLFGHRHPQESPPMHAQMVEAWRNADEMVCIEAFREAGKTSTAEEFLTLEGCFGNFNYCLLIAETYTKACQRLEAIDAECRSNVRLHSAFGGKVLLRKSTENRVWFKSGALIEAIGWEQELQSFKYHGDRPDLAYLDDPENQERVRDTAAVEASMRKFWLELVPALNKTKRRIRVTQTRRAEDCMVTRFAQSKEWLYLGFPICDGDPDDPQTVSTWPQRYPMKWIREEKQRYQEAGMLGEFLQAYMLQVTDPASKPFKEEMLAAMDVSPYHWMPRYAIFDPARTQNEKRKGTVGRSDRYGSVVVSRLGSRILVHESDGSHLAPDAFIDSLFAINEKHSPAKIGIEKNALDDWIMQPIRLACLRRGVALPVVALQAPQDRSKEQFILGLQPFMAAKDIVLVGGKIAHAALVAEIVNFPQGPRDILNALAYSLKMFSGTPMYENFGAANIFDAPTPSLGETVYVAWNASPSEAVAVAVVRDGRRLAVAGDWSAAGATRDAVAALAFEVHATFPRASFQHWVPADVFDQFQRIALVPALRLAGCTPYRGAHVAESRGALSDRINTVQRQTRLFTVDNRARLTLNALAAGYALPVERGGRTGSLPELGLSRLIAEGLECMTAALDHAGEQAAIPAGANIRTTPDGREYVSARPY